MTSTQWSIEPTSKVPYIQNQSIVQRKAKAKWRTFTIWIFHTRWNKQRDYKCETTVFTIISVKRWPFQSNNRMWILLNTLCFRIRFGEFSDFQWNEPKKKKEKIWNKIRCDIRKYCYFDIPIETNGCSKEW